MKINFTPSQLKTILRNVARSVLIRVKLFALVELTWTECQGGRLNPSGQRPIQRARAAEIAVDCDANQILIGLVGAQGTR